VTHSKDVSETVDGCAGARTASGLLRRLSRCFSSSCRAFRQGCNAAPSAARMRRRCRAFKGYRAIPFITSSHMPEM
jgi:hypothetical protein